MQFIYLACKFLKQLEFDLVVKIGKWSFKMKKKK
ncbi:hypothetical protein ABIC84_003296 [Mucilaginibacter sp. 3215]